MKRDDPPLALDGNFDQVIVQGPAARLSIYVAGVIGCLAGPALLVSLVLAGELAWQGVVGAVATTIVLGSFGALEIMSTVRMRRRVQRLARNGRPATGRVIGARGCTLGEETGIEWTLRISGPQVREFETTHRDKDDRGVGDEFPVVVDPTDNIFMILR